MLMHKSKGIAIPEDERQLAWPTAAIPADLSREDLPWCFPASLTLLLPAEGW